MKDETEAQLRNELKKISGKIDSILQDIQRCNGGEDDPSKPRGKQDPNRDEQG
jgi:hypothetical protein